MLWTDQMSVQSFCLCVNMQFVTTLVCTQLTNTKHSWQNGTRCRDGVNVLWCRSHLVWLVFEGSIPTCACFHSENVLVTCRCVDGSVQSLCLCVCR